MNNEYENSRAFGMGCGALIGLLLCGAACIFGWWPHTTPVSYQDDKGVYRCKYTGEVLEDQLWGEDHEHCAHILWGWPGHKHKKH